MERALIKWICLEFLKELVEWGSSKLETWDIRPNMKIIITKKVKIWTVYRIRWDLIFAQNTNQDKVNPFL